MLFAILQKYEFSSKSQPVGRPLQAKRSCLRYCKSTSFQANHNKQAAGRPYRLLFAILQKYEFSSKSQHKAYNHAIKVVVCDTAKVRVFKQITTRIGVESRAVRCLRYCKSTSFQANHNADKVAEIVQKLFAILQKYEFSSKSQHISKLYGKEKSCLRYCKSTSFQANHNQDAGYLGRVVVVCDTAKVRVFKQITT